MLNTNLLKQLPKENIFSLIEELKTMSSEKGVLKLYTPNQYIVKKGEKLDGMYLPIDNSLELLNGDEHIGYLQKGRTLALTSVIQNKPINYDVKATDNTKVLFLDKKYLSDIFEESPEVKSYLLLIANVPAIRNFKNLLLNADMNQRDIVHLISLVKPIAEIRNEIIENNLVFIFDGEVRITSKENTDHIINARLKRGAYFGGAYIPPPHRSNYDYQAKDFRGYMLSHQALIRNIKDNNILDKIVGEPWLNSRKIKSTYDLDSFKTRLKYKGKKVAEEEIVKHIDADFDFNQLRFARDDLNGTIATLYNTLIYFDKEACYDRVSSFFYQNANNLSGFKICSLLNEYYIDTVVSNESDDQNIECPYMTFLGNRAILVVSKKKKNRICIDPLFGVVEVTQDEINKHSSGEKIALKENEHLSEIFDTDEASLSQTEKNSKIKEILFSIILENKSSLTKIFILSLAGFAFTVMIPLLSQFLLDEVLKTRDTNTLATTAIGMLICYFYIVLFTFIKNKELTNLGIKIDMNFTTLVYKVALNLKQEVINKLQVGGIINRLNEVAVIRTFFSAESLNTLVSMITATLYVGILAFYSPYLTIIPIVYAVVLFLIRKVLKKQLINIATKLFDLKSISESFLASVVSTIKTIKAFGTEKTMATQWDNKIAKETDYEKSFLLRSSVLNSINQSFSGIVQIAGIWIVIYFSLSGGESYSPGEIFAISQYLQKMVSPINGFINFLVDLDEVEVSLEKISGIVFGEKDPNLTRQKKNTLEISGKVKLERVSFRYDHGERWVLKDINLTIFPRQTIALVGRSGSGKTTLANLIASDQLPTTGKVYYDDMDSDTLSYGHLKSQIGFIQQSNNLFAGSIKDNIAFDDDTPVNSLIDEAAHFSNCNEFLNRFPQKYDTYIAEGGTGLSGGQKQRVSISRIYYKNPKILIFDEATSALDSQTEKTVLQNIHNLAESRTIILIAHRLSTIKNADFIYVLEQGEIIERGTHKELIANKGFYTDLFKEQFS